MLVVLCGCSGKGYYELSGKKFVLDETKYTMTFEDNFNTIDFTKWKVGDFDLRRAAYYDYTEEHLFTNGGNLIMRTKWKDGAKGEGYYTTWLEGRSSDGKSEDGYTGFSQTYGYFEIRCKVPPSHGIWSAFWLMPDNNLAFSESDLQGTGMDGAEIDIYESAFYSRAGENNIMQSAIHVDGYSKEKLKSKGSNAYLVPNLYTEFHTYGLMWTEDEYIFYIDGYETWRTDFLKDTSSVDEFMILSMEVGGDNDGEKVTKLGAWAGDPSDNDKNAVFDWVIDYVKVYAKK